MPRVPVSVFAAIAVFAFGSLFSGAGYLVWLLPGGLPFGNALTAAGLFSTSFAAFSVSSPNSALRRFAAVSVALSLAWLPVSIGLAGNLALNFAGANGSVWISLSLVTFCLALISVTWAGVQHWRRGVRPRGEAAGEQ